MFRHKKKKRVQWLVEAEKYDGMVHLLVEGVRKSPDTSNDAVLTLIR